jgi:hypothetical protein
VLQNVGIFFGVVFMERASRRRRWYSSCKFFQEVPFASAMARADYGGFAEGRWYLSKNIQEMLDYLKILLRQKK